MTTSAFYSAVQHEVFEMDDSIHDNYEQTPFEMEDDYGFYEDLDLDDGASPPMCLPLSDDEDSALPIPCGSRIEDENPDSLSTSPPILSPCMVDSIAEDGLPWSMQDAQWDRLFTSSRDGPSFGTFMRRVRGQGQTIIVAKTSDGRIVGGYAPDVWSGRKQQTSDSQESEASNAFLFIVEPPAPKTEDVVISSPAGNSFIPGLGELGTSPTSAFDFDFHHLSITPVKQHIEKPRVDIFKPSQKLHTNVGMKQACQIGHKLISMTDGNGDLSLVIENSFSRCVFTGEDREEFTIVEFEVYGISED